MDDLDNTNGLQEINIEDITTNESLPPLPNTEAEYNEDVQYNASSENSTAEFGEDTDGNVQNYSDDIDWGSLQPVDQSGYRNPAEVDYNSLTPYDVSEKPATIWDEAAIKMDMGNLTQYRAKLGRDVMFGKLSVEEAKQMTYARHGEILNKYGITKVPEFSFAKFKADPLRTVIGETAQMLPFYWGGAKKGAAYTAAIAPITIGKNIAAGNVLGSAAPGAGNIAGTVGGGVMGLIEATNVGMLMGTFHESMEVEGSNLYLDLREKGVEHNPAMAAGLAGGLLNGVLETASLGFMTAPIKGAAKKVAAKMLWDSVKKSPVTQKAFKGMLTKVTVEYFKRIGVETTTEMTQDVVNNVMTLLAAQVSSVESAKPTAEDWKNIVTKTGPQTMAAMLLMGLVSTPFDVMNAKVGDVNNEGGGEVGTKADIEKNITDLSEGKEVVTGSGLTLEGRVEYSSESGIAYDTAEGMSQIQELEAEYNEAENNINEYKKTLAGLEKKKNLTEEETAYTQRLRDSIQYETDYQKLVTEEIANISSKVSKQENTQTRKKELTEKGKKEKLSAEELQELNDIWIEEEKARGESEINDKTHKARERELNKNIRDMDTEIEKLQKKEDSARENRNKIEEQQDKNSQKIAELEKENNEIEKALEKTDIEADRAELETTLKKNREQIADLKRNNKALEKQRIKANKEIEDVINQQEELGNQRNILNEERSKLSEGILNENGKIDLTAGGYKNAQLSALKTRLKVMEQGIKRGVRMTRREIRDVQNSAISLIKNSDMSDKDKTKFLVTIRDMNSQKKFDKALPGLLDKISSLEEKHNKKTLSNYIKKLVKSSKPKKGGKTPVGKFNADIQKILDDISYTVNLTEAQANKEIENIFDMAGERALTDEETQKARILNDFGGMENKSARDLLKNARALKMLIEDGKIAGQFREQVKKEHKEKILAEAKESIIGDTQPTGNKKKDKAAFINSLKQAFRSFGAMSETWEGLMTIASLHDKDRKLVKILDVFPAKMARIKGEMEAFNKFAGLAMNALGCKTFKEFAKKVKEDTRVIDVGVYTDKDGKQVTLQASRAQARKLYMEMQDPELIGQLTENNGYTFKSDIENIKQQEAYNSPLDILYGQRIENDLNFSIVDKSTEQLLEDFLTPEDFDLIQVEFDFYKDYRKRLNGFYREKYGIDMPDNEYYSPIARELDGSDRQEDWRNTGAYQKGITPSNFKDRKNNANKIKLQNDIDVMQNHIAESEHFMALDSFVTDAKAIFGNAEIREVIKDKYGNKFLRIIDQHLKDIMADGVESVRPEMGIFAKFRNMFTGAALGARAKIFFTQLTAIGVFSDAIPAADFAKGITDFVLHPAKATKILSESYLLKDRQNSINMEIKDIVKSQEYQAITRYKDFRNCLYFFTQLGDKWSIIAGGWSIYRYTLNKTGDKAAAMEAFERAINKYQQSGHVDNLSSWQRGNPMQKAMVMFMSDQMRQMQAEVRAVKDAIIQKDSKSIANAAKTIAIMHFILPNLVQFVANGFTWDDVDQLKASILGPFTSIAIMGQVMSAGLSLALKYYGAKIEDERFKDIDAFESLDMNIFGPFNRLCQDVSKYLDKLYKDDADSEDFNELWVKIFKNFVGPYAGIPLKYGIDVWEKSPEYLEDDKYLDLLKLWCGVSPYIIENKGKNKED